LPIDFKFEEGSSTDFETSFEYHSDIEAPTVLYYNKDFFYGNGYKIEVINDETKENLLESGAIVLDEQNDNYINIIGSKLLENNTRVRITFKAL